MNELDPRLWTGRTPLLERATWEAALEDARREQREKQDDSSTEDYDSEDDGYDACDNERNSWERDATPDTTTSSFGESPLHQDGPERSQSCQSSDKSTIHPMSSADSQQSSRSVLSVYRDPQVTPAGLVHRDDAVVSNRSVLGSLDPNIAVSRPDGRMPSWSHGTEDETNDDASSSAAVSHTESHSCRSNNSTHPLGLNASQPSRNNEIPSSPVEASSTSEETAVKSLIILEESGAESLVSLSEAEVEALDTPGETEAETETQHGSELEDTEGGSQDGNNDEEQTGASAGGLRIIDSSDTDSDQDCIAEISAIHSSPEFEDAATDRDGDGDGNGFTDLLSFDDSLFNDAVVTEVVTTPLAPVPSRPGFRRYPQASTPLSQLKLLWNTMAQTVSHRRRHSGFIYAFARRELPGFLKIGYVKGPVPERPSSDPVNSRIELWQEKCGHLIKEVFRVKIPCLAAQRIESLVHMTLRESRWVEECRRCARTGTREWGDGRGGQGQVRLNHKEWFEVDRQSAEHVVNQWAKFAEQLPYDHWGKLVDFWSEKVDEQRSLVRQGDTTMRWLERMPQLVELLRRREFGSMIGPLDR